METEALKIFLTSEQALWLERETGRPTPRLKSNPPSHVTTEPKGCRIKSRSNSKASRQPPGRISASAGEMQWQDRVPAPKKHTTQSRLGEKPQPLRMSSENGSLQDRHL